MTMPLRGASGSRNWVGRVIRVSAPGTQGSTPGLTAEISGTPRLRSMRDVEQRLVAAGHVVAELADQVAGPELGGGFAARQGESRHCSGTQHEAAAAGG